MPMKILVVDDEKLIRDVIKEYLINDKYEVDEASSGKIALEKLQNNTYDLLVLDIMMPEMDGFSMLEKLEKEKRIPTIILSPRGEEYDKLYGFDLGIDEKDIPYIWNKYYKNEKEHKRSLVGTGLGLNIVKSILELHEYEYGVDSRKNKGTTFYFEIKK